MSNRLFPVKQLNYISGFRCDSSKCVKNCCSIYSIYVDKFTVERYKEKAPELLEYIVKQDDGKYLIPSNQNGCFLLQNGLCKIHCEHGTDLLPNVCFIYPRVYNRLRDEVYVTTNFMCNYLNKIMLTADNAFEWSDCEVDRIPDDVDEPLKDRFEDYKTEELLSMSQAIIQSVDDPEFNSEEALIRLILLARLFDEITEDHWPFVYKRYLNIANKNKVLRKYQDINNFKFGSKRELTDSLIHIFLSVHKDSCEKPLEDYIKSVTRCLEGNTSEQLRAKFMHHQKNSKLDSMLKKYLKAKLSKVIFPVCNWRNCLDDLTLIATCYAMVRLIILANEDVVDNVDEIAKVIAVVESTQFIKRLETFEAYKNFGFINSNELIRLLVEL